MSLGGMDIGAMVQLQDIFSVKADDEPFMERKEEHHISAEVHLVTTVTIGVMVDKVCFAFGAGIEDQPSFEGSLERDLAEEAMLGHARMGPDRLKLCVAASHENSK